MCVVKVAEVFLKLIRLFELRIILEQLFQFSLFFLAEFLLAKQKVEAFVFQVPAFVLWQVVPHLNARAVQGSVNALYDVETVNDNSCVREFFLHSYLVLLPHVDGDAYDIVLFR